LKEKKLNLKDHSKIQALTKLFNSLSPVIINGFSGYGDLWIYNTDDIKEDITILYGIII
jgi:hypothetical protein